MGGGKFAILNPCPKKWTDLAGEGRVRYCDVCRKHVHALDEYVPEERDRLWRKSEGHLCGMIAGMSPEPVRTRRAVLVGSLLTVIAPLWAQTGRVRIRVTDPTGAVIPTATGSLLGMNNRPARSASANAAGEIVFTDLPLGDSKILVNVPGLNSKRIRITVRNGAEQLIEARLEISATLGEVVTVAAIEPPAADAPAPALVAVPLNSTPLPMLVPSQSKRP